ncbi:helicase-exonuclease AddAB subunit AddA [Paenibacillus sp. y28]
MFLHKYKRYWSGPGKAGHAPGAEVLGKGADMTGGQGAENDTGRELHGLLPAADETGIRIDLARNFRSRQEVVDGVNYVFRQIMHEAAAEMDYDRSAELVCGASYPAGESAAEYAVELLMLEQGGGEDSREPEDESSEEEETPAPDEAGEEQALEAAQLEARAVAMRIRELLGDGGRPFLVFDKRISGLRPLQYRDIVILMRSSQAWAPVFMEELKLQGIPAYADLKTGYFEATEVETIMSLLQIIDNPLQDIPLAAVLRSPIVGLNEEELALLRVNNKRGLFYEAIMAYIASGIGTAAAPEKAGGTAEPHLQAAQPPAAKTASDESVSFEHAEDELRLKIQHFASQLSVWREEARHGALADLLWRIYRETGYYDFVGGLPGGLQRQANLKALYDRARQYEATSLRGLFRFLRFIERMRDSGGDLGTARALGEQEDVVRIMTIHSSKGLEFPVVFVAGLSKTFNRRDLNGRFLLHKQLGFGPAFVDEKLRIQYPSLPMLAIRRKMRLELLAEEMRVLYVALTRAKEKLILLGAVKGLDKKLAGWGRSLAAQSWALPAFDLVKAQCYMDWIAPVVLRHPAGAELRQRAALELRLPPDMADDPSRWHVSAVPAAILSGLALAEAAAGPEAQPDAFRLEALRNRLPVASTGEYAEAVQRQLGWIYPHQEATGLLSKTTVTELKRLDRERQAQSDELEPESPFLPGWFPAGGEGDESAAGEAAGALNITASTGAFAEAGTQHDGGNGSGERPAAAPRGSGPLQQPVFKRPKFMEARQMTAAERGTAAHLVMQHLPLPAAASGIARMTPEVIRQVLDTMTDKRLITLEQREAIQPERISRFFDHEIGQRLLHASQVLREIPFSYGLPAAEVYPAIYSGGAQLPADGGDTLLIQGVIDCLFEENGRWVLLDYKTDAVRGASPEELRDRYRVQIDLYKRSISSIWKAPIEEAYLYFLDGGIVVEM